MRFRIEQLFAADIDTLVDALTDPAYLRDVMAKLPDLGAPVIENQERTSAVVHQKLKYTFAGSLPSVVTKVIDPRKLSWIEDTTIDLIKNTGSFTMTPIHYPQFFSAKGSWTLAEVQRAGNQATLRVIEGSLKVNSPVPFVGGQVERAIVSGLRERLAEEPDAFAVWHMARNLKQIADEP